MIKFLNKYKWVITGVILAAVLLVIAFFCGGNVEEAKKQAEQNANRDWMNDLNDRNFRRSGGAEPEQ